MKTKQNPIKIIRSPISFECGKAVVDYIDDKYISVNVSGSSAELSLNIQTALDLYRALDKMFENIVDE